jgi:predicted  nucleic acid-binding Zn-ribbon protein
MDYDAKLRQLEANMKAYREDLNKVQMELDEIQKAYQELKKKYDSNLTTIKRLEPKVGQKRKRWQMDLD